MRSRVLAATFAFAVTLGLSGPIAAQESTPMPGEQGAGSCADVEPRDAAFFEQVAASPEAQQAGQQQAQASPEGTPAAFTMPEGEEVDDATVAEVAGVYAQLVDCLNQGDYLRAYALYTDDYLLRNLSAEAISRLEATPVPVEESMQVQFGGVLDARLLEDGRIAALVITSNAQTGDTVLFSIMEQVDGRWMIDEETVVEVEAIGTPAA